ncbi:MAG: tRNA adenosine(34) deaminase TadA [Oscillospiraceae bacterium]|nr:tRNA adenosine(34) deaminase TadA [Oscillospiraceae bacterium]MBQ6698128.1 tRNA adenosine(34) deaminase TadA [Oscillospiraceae bacterium]MBQ7054466.1 tRNA adenosine(34) deaminase TadA [Oscillospiraceae bacterium]
MENVRNDEFYMREAIALAQKAEELGEAPVGCVIVLDGEIIGRGYNLRESSGNPLTHAEIIAINEACRYVESFRLVGCELYVTLEPCPMCAGACINSRVERVIFGAYDPKAGSCGSVVNLFDLPYNHKPALCGGVLEEECASLLSRFFLSLRERNKLRKKAKLNEV